MKSCGTAGMELRGDFDPHAEFGGIPIHILIWGDLSPHSDLRAGLGGLKLETQ